jgi:hypothetical protein
LSEDLFDAVEDLEIFFGVAVIVVLRDLSGHEFDAVPEGRYIALFGFRDERLRGFLELGTALVFCGRFRVLFWQKQEARDELDEPDLVALSLGPDLGGQDAGTAGGVPALTGFERD